VNVSGSIHIGRRYLQRHPAKVTLLTAAITLSLFLPVSIVRVVQTAERHLRARSAETPLLLGAPGSPLELVFNGVYFAEPAVETLTLAEGGRPAEDGMATVIPVHARFEARGYRIVGTSLDYFDFRRLRASRGALFARLGDCVVGAVVAQDLGLAPGDGLVSTPEQVFDLAGVYPLKMRVTGVLAPTGGMDDRAVFVDLRTAWIIEGLAHGHEEAGREAGTVLAEDDSNVALNASVVEYTEVTPDNADSFHFHGDPGGFPITAAIVRPRDTKARTILLGRYVGDRRSAQLVRPDDVMANLFATVFQVRDVVVMALVAVGAMAVGIATLVFLLSNQLRRREFESLASIGADPGSMRLLVTFEALFVVTASVVLAGGLLLILDLVLPRLLPLLMS
jgi:putative ABC transport system permease protein